MGYDPTATRRPGSAPLDLPAALQAELKRDGLLHPAAPVPA